MINTAKEIIKNKDLIEWAQSLFTKELDFSNMNEFEFFHTVRARLDYIYENQDTFIDWRAEILLENNYRWCAYFYHPDTINDPYESVAMNNEVSDIDSLANIIYFIYECQLEENLDFGEPRPKDYGVIY